MGQKVHPIGFRLGITKTWSAQWYADKDYTKLLQEDLRIRKLVDEKLAAASISKVEIERGLNYVTVTVPGISPATGFRSWRASSANAKYASRDTPPDTFTKSTSISYSLSKAWRASSGVARRSTGGPVAITCGPGALPFSIASRHATTRA